ncbi:MAG: UbiA family prenyltransferase [Gammaproteobacteria bacterium]
MNETRLLFVDLDNTLTRSDFLLEPLLRLLKSDPVLIFLLPLWLFHGRGYFKKQLSDRIKFDVSEIQYDQKVLDYLAEQKAQGREIVLATASNQSFADQVAAHLGLFEHVIASSADHNTKGKNKLAAMKRYAGERAFDYMGDSHADIHSWQYIKSAMVVSPQPGVLRRLEKASIPIELINAAPLVEVYLKALRPWQWLKNGLIFVPLILAKQLFYPASLGACIVAFISFCMIASAGYLVNDLLDIESDRLHPRKRYRPLASGVLSLWNIFILMVMLFFAGLVLSWFVSGQLALLLLIYFLMVTAYSLELKQQALVDVILIAGFYTTRILAGGFAADVEISFWLLAFSIFIFLSLALLKRCTEINTTTRAKNDPLPGRGYFKKDEPILASMGITSGYLSVVVIALYINSTEVTTIYNSPQSLWLVCPLVLYWISRMWLKTSRNEMDDDPLVFAMRDKVSWVTGILLFFVILLATV